MAILQLTEEEFNSVHEMHDEGANSKDIATELEMRLPAVNVALKFTEYGTYARQWDSHLKDFQEPSAKEGDEEEDQEEEPRSKSQQLTISPLERGHFRGTLSKDHDTYADMREGLGISIKGLWKVIGLLEMRKGELERQIRSMEEYVRKGLSVIENE